MVPLRSLVVAQNRATSKVTVAVVRWGKGAQAPKSCPSSQIFGYSSSATGWINWFYSKFRLAVVASQMMRGQAPKYFFLEPPLESHLLWHTSVATLPEWKIHVSALKIHRNPQIQMRHSELCLSEISHTFKAISYAANVLHNASLAEIFYCSCWFASAQL